MKRIQWTRYGKWHTPLLEAWMMLRAMDEPLLPILGYSRGFTHVLSIDGECYLDPIQWEQLKRHFHKLWKRRGNQFLRSFIEYNRSITTQAFNRSSRFKLPDQRASITNKELRALFKPFMDPVSVMPPMALNWTITALAEVLQPIVLEHIDMLKTRRRLRERSDLLLVELLQPRTTAHLIQEEEQLLAIANIVTLDPNLRRRIINSSPSDIAVLLKRYAPTILLRLANHRRTYAWLAVIDWWGSLPSLSSYLRRLREMLKGNPRTERIKRQTERRQRELRIRRLLAHLDAPPRFRHTIDYLRNLLDSKLLQWDTVSMTGYRTRPLLTEIGRRLGLSYEDVLHLLPKEIMRSLKEGLVVPKSEVARRIRNHAVMNIGTGLLVFSGRNAITLYRQQLPSISRQSGTAGFKGTIAYPGIMHGRVRIIPTVESLRKMREGEILVCPMTNPDYMPAIRKAKAIVTDEGGILCHAAIVARELKIPTITGTKIASQTLKNGDYVEVDATAGIVRRVSSA